MAWCAEQCDPSAVRSTVYQQDERIVMPPSEEAKRAIKLWRAMLFLVHYDELRFTRSLEPYSRDRIQRLSSECWDTVVS